MAKTKHSSNFRPIRARVSPSNVNITYCGRPATSLQAILSQSRHCRLVDLTSSMVKHIAHFLVRWTTEPDPRNIIEWLETAFVFPAYGAVDGRHMVLVSLKLATIVRSQDRVWCSRSSSCCHFWNVDFVTWRLPDFLEGPASLALHGCLRPAFMSDQQYTWTENARKCPDFCPMTDRYNSPCERILYMSVNGALTGL